MIVVNLFGVPGSGKSTGAAYIFSKLKMKGVNAELITEYAKDQVWAENKTVFENQCYIFGKQSYRISRCENKVDVIITDSPLLLSVFYNNKKIKALDDLVIEVNNKYDNVNFIINRSKPYNPKGRLQTEEQSKELEIPMLDFVNRYCNDYISVKGDESGYDIIVDMILNKLNK